MTQLAIKVRGEVLSSNFDEWKLDLIAKIQAVNTELSTDSQFAQAQSDVKTFKAAEQALKKTKEAAISQASDIQRLFSSIDEVSAEVRQVRLSLERQIKQRKAEIKDDFIELGIANIRKYIELQGPEFRSIDHSDYLERSLFVEATKYRANIRSLQGAIDDACARIRTQIDERAAMVRANALKLDSLPAAQQALFQDRDRLLALDESRLNTIIDQRIAVFEQQAGTETGKSEPDPDVSDEPEQPDEAPLPVNDLAESKSIYTLRIELSATTKEAEEFFRQFRVAYSGHPLVRTFQLEKA